MSTPRTQDKRYWVQVEYAPTGTSRRAYQIDLNMVDEVMVVYGSNPFDPGDNDYAEGVQIVYAGTMKPLTLSNKAPFTVNSANWFYEEWKKFITLQAEQPAGTVGTILLPEQNGLFK